MHKHRKKHILETFSEKMLCLTSISTSVPQLFEASRQTGIFQQDLQWQAGIGRFQM